MSNRNDPASSRPHMPGYGIAPAPKGRGLLPWSWAEERLAAAHNYWVATTRAGGAPHLMPVWGVWLDGAFFFSTGASSLKARNLAADARCTITTERADEAVIVEGVAREIAGAADLAPFIAGYKRKYDWDLDPSTGGYYTVAPRRVFGFIEHANQFGDTATRWTFDG